MLSNGAAVLFAAQAQVWANQHLFGHGAIWGAQMASVGLVGIAVMGGLGYDLGRPRRPGGRLRRGVEVVVLFGLPAAFWSERLLTMGCQRC